MNQAPTYDVAELNRLLDRVKTAAFLGSNSAFLGTILCQVKDIVWDETIPTAQTNGSYIWWNPHWFLAMPESTRKTILLHELWHIGRLHFLRGEGKDMEAWQAATDIVINNGLERDGYTFDGVAPLINRKWDDLSEEEIYHKIVSQQQAHRPKPQPKPGGNPGQGKPQPLGDDLRQGTAQEVADAVASVVMAKQQAMVAGQAGSIPGNIQTVIDEFLAPILPWERLLYRFMEELTEEDLSWAKRNRRYLDIYMPGRVKVDGGLSHLAYFLDVSGSVSDYDIKRFNSEVKYIKDQLQPTKLTLITFDTRIRDVVVFEEDDSFEKIVVTGRGGTSLVEVEKWISENKPTAAVIFTDMQCAPMAEPRPRIPVLWVVIGNYGHKPTFGQVIKMPNKK